MRVLVAGVGNTLRVDDGFGVIAARRLQAMSLPEGVHVLETGTSGMTLVQELMEGYDAMIVLDIVDRGRPPGTIMLIEPELRDATAMSHDERHSLTGNTHLATPSSVMMMAKAMGNLPAQVLLIACQPLDAVGLGMELTPPVAAAVDVAVAEVESQLARLCSGMVNGSGSAR
jgi:hydrogenase maturation protease